MVTRKKTPRTSSPASRKPLTVNELYAKLIEPEQFSAITQNHSPDREIRVIIEEKEKALLKYIVAHYPTKFGGTEPREESRYQTLRMNLAEAYKMEEERKGIDDFALATQRADAFVQKAYEAIPRAQGRGTGRKLH